MKATPLTRTESVREPPATFFTPIIFKLRSSSSDKTASTAISPKNSFWWAMSLEFSAVCAHFSSRDLFSLREHNTRGLEHRPEYHVTGRTNLSLCEWMLMDRSLRCCSACGPQFQPSADSRRLSRRLTKLQAVRYPLMICALCSPSSTNCCVACQKVSLLLAARTTRCVAPCFLSGTPRQAAPRWSCHPQPAHSQLFSDAGNRRAVLAFSPQRPVTSRCPPTFLRRGGLDRLRALS